MQEELFSTDLKRLTEILAVNLYNDPFVPIRELLQNANDACIIRKGFSAFNGTKIIVSIDTSEKYIEISDNGCGMTENELKNVLCRIASTNKIEKRKKLLDLGFDTALSIAGKFGLGILSCFIVSCRVEIVTRSMEPDSSAFFWYSLGDGKYLYEETDADAGTGTRVRLYLKDERYIRELLNVSKLCSVIDKYCRFLTIPIYMSGSNVPLNAALPPWHPDCSDEEIEQSIRKHFAYGTLYHFRIDYHGSVRITSGRFKDSVAEDLTLRAIIFIPDEKISMWGGGGNSDIYAAGIYIGRINGLLPEWFKFGNAIIESPSLDLTLGRDSVVEDKWRDAVNQLVTAEISSHIFANIKNRASVLSSRLDSILKIHNEIIKTRAVSDYKSGDKQFFSLVKDIVTFPFREKKVSISGFAESTASIGTIDGKRVLYYFAQGGGERGNGLQERLIFDCSEIPYLDARNYFDREFLVTYNETSTEFTFVTLNKGLERVLGYDLINESQSTMIESAFRELGIAAKACIFSPVEIPALIQAPSVGQKGNDIDLLSPDGMHKLLEILSRKEFSVTSAAGVLLCVNVSNELVKGVFDRVRKDGLQPVSRMALRLVYNNAVIMFGDHNTKELLNVYTTGSSLILSYLRSMAETESERARFELLFMEKEKQLIEGKRRYKRLEDSVSIRKSESRLSIAEEVDGIYISYFPEPDTDGYMSSFSRLAEQNGFRLIKHGATDISAEHRDDRSRIRECVFFMAIVTNGGFDSLHDVLTCGRTAYAHTPETTCIGQKYSGRICMRSTFLEEKGFAMASNRIVLLLVEDPTDPECIGTSDGVFRLDFDKHTFADKAALAMAFLNEERKKMLSASVQEKEPA